MHNTFMPILSIITSGKHSNFALLKYFKSVNISEILHRQKSFYNSVWTDKQTGYKGMKGKKMQSTSVTEPYLIVIVSNSMPTNRYDAIVNFNDQLYFKQ